MTRTKGVALLGALVLSAGLWAGPAAAEDPGQAEGVAAWATVPAAELAQERAGAIDVNDDLAVSLNIIWAEVTNTVDSNGGTINANGGAVDIAAGAISGNVLSITAINTGNNVVMNNIAAVAINF